jgi:NADPH:quinone reductase-like Zn-dependent oxidoreductase
MNQTAAPSIATHNKAAWVEAKAGDAAGLAAAVKIVDFAREPLPPGCVRIEVKSTGVNPSDVKAVLGVMPHAIWPRTPGRDYAGVVVEGPAQLIGKEVWGSGGELGIRRNGAHAHYLVIEEKYLREKPSTLTLAEAGAVGVPFITASEGLREAGGVSPGDVVLVFGANGKVGEAAIQIAAMSGAALIFGVERTKEAYRGHSNAPVDMIDASSQDIAAHVREKSGGHGADIVFNTVGSPYFEAANNAMALKARQIFISTIEHSVPFNIFQFYRGRHKFIGLDTLALDQADCGEILEGLKPGFESRALRPFAVKSAQIYPLAGIVDAYKAVLAGAPDRVVLDPSL